MASKTVIGIYPTGHEPLELCSSDPHRLIARPEDELQEIRAELVAVRRLLLRIVPKSHDPASDHIELDNFDYHAATRDFVNAAI